MPHSNRQVLTEVEAKALLKRYGIPVVDEVFVATEEEAVTQAAVMGFPVVVKGVGKRLLHKTERGLVILNVNGEEKLREAYRFIRVRGGGEVEGIVIQPQVRGRREFVAGLIRDPQFGPSVMFGLGGIFTEALDDVVFRIAPVSEDEARLMVEEIRARKLLAALRGEAAIDRDVLTRIIVGLSRLGLERPEVQEIDVNPLVADMNGRLTAVDALIIMSEPPVTVSCEEDRNEIRAALDRMIHARAMAVVGASRPPQHGFPGMYMCMRRFGFPGRLYPVNPNVDEIEGVKTYPRVRDLPEPVDLVIVSVPARSVPMVLEECAATGNRNIHIFTSGFKETGEEEGIRLQNQMAEIACRGKLHIIGPNCMGLYVPASRLVTWVGASPISGPVAFISQSGGNAEDFTNYTTSRYGIHFSKCISYGNALTLDATDFLDYLAHDEETRIITMYLEGVKDGRRFLECVSEVNRTKPIIVFKGGLTEAGARAVSSHTGSLAGGEKIWQAFFRQTGAIPVFSLEEMADVVLACRHLGSIPGNRVALLGIGGGIGVYVADTCARAGISLPPLSPGLVTRLRNLIPPAGTMIRNPIDAVPAFHHLPLLGDVLELLAASGEIDVFIVSLPLDWLFDEGTDGGYIDTVAHYLAGEGKKRLHGRPLVVVRRQYRTDNPRIKANIPLLDEIMLSAHIPIYDHLERAVMALARLNAYTQFVNRARGRDL